MDQDISHWYIWDDLARDFIRQFQYNIDIAPDRNLLTNLKKKSSESFREYAVKWRKQASRVKPPMDEVQMVTVFLQAQEADYFQNMMTPQHYYPHQDLAYTPQPYSVMNAQPYVRPQQQANRNQAPFPRNQPPYQTHYNPRPPQNNFHPHEPPKRPNFTPIGETYSSLLPKLVQMGLLQLVPQTRQNPASPAYRAGTRCAYHSGAEGHDTDDCWTLKRAVENLIEQRKIVLRDEDVPNMTNNPLPAHNNGLSEKKIEVETGATPPKDVVLYVPQGRKEKQMTLSPPRRFELNKTTQMYVPKGAYVMRGPIKPSRLNEPVVIGRAPQKPMKDPTTVPWNYNKTVVTYKGKEIPGEVQENNPIEKYSNLEEVNNATRKRFPLKKPVSAEKAEAFFQNMKMADYEVIDQLRKFSEQVSLLALLMNSAEHQK
uniref:Retrotransposon gag domain-containing protein n=1 Tax=Nicotiana tabacum TaxID=4097 RepID=A0A1S3XV51_TOBAC